MCTGYARCRPNFDRGVIRAKCKRLCAIPSKSEPECSQWLRSASDSRRLGRPVPTARSAPRSSNNASATPPKNRASSLLRTASNSSATSSKTALRRDLNSISLEKLASYHSAVTADANVLHYTREYKVKQLELDPSLYEDLRKFTERVACDEATSAVLKKK
jgi:hypothetical protein